MDNHQQTSDGDAGEPGLGPMMGPCCILQLLALLGCIWTGVRLGLRYASGDPPLLAAGKVLLGLVLGFVGGALAATLLLCVDHITGEWSLRRYRRSQEREARQSGGDDGEG